MASPSTSLLPQTTAPGEALLFGAQWQLDTTRTITWGTADNDFYSWSNPGAAAGVIQAAFAEWEKVVNIDFEYVGHQPSTWTAGADIAISLADSRLLQSDDGTLALGVPPDTGIANVVLGNYGLTRAIYPRPEGDIWLNNDWATLAQQPGPGGLLFQTLLHEIGHALGLKHPHDHGFDGRPRFDQVGLAEFDSEYFTVMSYGDPAGADFSKGHAASPMPLDIVAIQYLYGANTTTGAGDTIYTLRGDQYGRTIYDVGGSDILDASSISTAMTLNIGQGCLSGFASDPSSFVAVAFGTTIENARGGAAGDYIVGNDIANQVWGGNGNDTLIGGNGNDQLWGELGSDQIFGGAGADAITADIGDVVFGGTDDDVITVLGSAQAYGGDGNDVLDGVNASTAAVLGGGNGNDIILSGAGSDTTFGGGGSDSISASSGDLAFGGVDADTIRASGPAQIYAGHGDDLIFGSSAGDTIGGGGGNDTLEAGGGNDLIYAGPGADVVDAGSGNDTIYGDDSDVVAGGVGDDVFLFTGGNMADGVLAVVRDFTHAAGDRLAVTTATFGKNVSGSDVLVDLNGDGTFDVRLENAGTFDDSDVVLV